MDSTFYVTLALGFVFGFAADWALDYFVRRRRVAPVVPATQDEVERLRAEKVRLAEQAASAESLRSVLNLRQSELDELRKELHLARINGQDPTGGQAYRAEFESLQNELSAKEAALQDLTLQVQTLSAQALARRDEGSGLEVEQLRQTIQDQADEVTALHQQLAEARNAAQSQGLDAEHLMPEIQKMRVDFEQRAELIVALEQRVRELESDLEDQDSATAEIVQLRSEREEFGRHLQHLQSQVQEREEHVQRLILETADLKRGLEGVEDARLLAAKAAALERDVESLKSISAAKDAAVAQAQEAMAKLEAQLAFRPSADDFAALQNQVSQRAEEVATFQATIEELQRNVQEEQDRVAELRSELESKDAVTHELQRLRETVEAERADRERDMTSARDEFQRRLADWEAQIQQMHDDLQGKNERLSKLEEERNAAASEAERLAAERAHFESQQNEIRAQLEVALRERERLEEALQEAGRVAAERAHFESQQNDIRTQLEAAERDRERLEVEKAEALQEAGRVAAELEHAHSERSRLESELASAQNEKLVIAQRLESAQTSEEPVLTVQPEQAVEPAVAQELEELRAVMSSRDEAMKRLEEQVSRLVRTFQTQREEPVARPERAPEERPVLSVAQFEVAAGRKDPLIQIRGIGHLFERKLWNAGVLTFAQLAALTPDDVYEIVQPAEWQRIEPDRWISEAATLSLGTGT